MMKAIQNAPQQVNEMGNSHRRGCIKSASCIILAAFRQQANLIQIRFLVKSDFQD